MMSKQLKIALAVGLTAAAAGISWWLLKPKPKEGLVQKEISIQEAQVGQKDKKEYQDWAGFRFEYPGDLVIEELELEDQSVYSSLEFTGTVEEKMHLRISQTKLANIKAWQDQFEASQVISNLKETNWADLKAIEFVYGAPANKRVAAVEEGVLYSLEAPADGGYWERALEMVLSSFEFDTLAPEIPETGGEIILLEETLE